MKTRISRYSLCGIAAALALMLLVVLAWSTMQGRIGALDRLDSNIAEMARIDEILTSSALLATATGDMAYHARYYAHVDVLNALIQQSIGMFDHENAHNRLNQTQNANDWLVATEERALSAMESGANPDAYDLLLSDEYIHHKREYMDGLKAAMTALELHANHGVERIRTMLVVLTAAILLAGFAGLRLLYTMRIERRALRLHKRQALVMRGLLGTFMDVQNNLLNNMVYFRTKVAYNLPFDDEDVRMIDDEIDRAKVKLADLVDTGIGKTRDLGGIVVVDTEAEEDRKVA